MPRYFSPSILTLIPVLCAASCVAQQSPTVQQSPAAYVYVSSQPINGTHQVYGFSAAANGQLTPIPTTPFTADLSALSLNGGWLFGVTDSAQTTVASYRIAADGSLQLKNSFNLASLPDSVGYGETTFLDHTGATLYVGTDQSENGGYESFQINQKTGQLSPLGYVGPSVSLGYPLTFIGDNKYAYGASSFRFSGEVFGFKRGDAGALTSYISGGTPTAAPGQFYLPFGTAADPYNHVVVGEFPRDASSYDRDGPPQLAVYTSDDSGQLSTTSTYQNMPSVKVVTPNGSGFALAMSPDGTHLAVAGDNGVQLFRMHGANPPTAVPGAELLGVDIESLYWDNAGHLYAISSGSQALAVFNVTATGGSLAPGSPRFIPAPASLIVLPK